jgi:hypothetical protein
MKKFLLTLLLGAGLTYASTLNGIAIIVNEEPITMYDVEKTMQVNGVSQQEAISYLIDKALFDEMVKEHGISADIFEINEYIERLANSNGMDLYAFKSIIKQEYPNYEVFENEARNAVIRQKLIAKLVRDNLPVANDEDMRLYYEKNQHKYLSAKTFEVVQYTSKNKASLNQAIQNPMQVVNEVNKTALTLEANSLQPQLQFILNGTKEHTFSPIFTADQHFVSMYVSKKSGSVAESYESAKAKVFNDIMMQREQAFLKEEFEKQKLTADIKVLR